MKHTKTYKILILLVSCLFVLTACRQEEVWEKPTLGVFLEVKPPQMTEKQVTTRGDVKNEKESEIKSLYIFVYESETATQPLYYSNKLNTTSHTVDLTNDNVAVYAIANVEDATFTGNESAQELESFKYIPKQELICTDVPSTGMPMICKKTGVNLSEGGIVELPMKALMARVDMNLKLSSMIMDAVNNYPQMTITKMEMGNIPTGVAFSYGNKTDFTGEIQPKTITWNVDKPQTIYNNYGEINSTFYIYENMQGTADADTYFAQDSNGLDKVAENARSNYKPELAKVESIDDKASYLKFTGEYINYHGVVNTASFLLYLGANHTDDFNVECNHQYKNNITITGLKKSNSSGLGDVSFDARVEIQKGTSGYFFYTNLLHERELDAHFNVLPMDVYIESDFENPHVTVTIQDDCEWIRIERIPQATMAASGYKAYTGIRDWFTTDLMGKLQKQASCYHRDRIYFYIDENISTSKRNATVTLTYTDNAGHTSTQNVVFEQVGLLPVNLEYSGKAYTLYIESTEEYLNHYDPLNEYKNAHVYEGLPWGSNNNTNNYNSDDVVYYYGFTATKNILEKAGLSYVPNRKLTEVPTFAAEYCNNKNKRNPNGSPITERTANTGIWYLPAIREMETIMKQYFLAIPVFQNSFYWSSAAAKKGSGFLGLGTAEENTRARATRVKITYNGSDAVFNYYQSGSKNDDHNYNTTTDYNYTIAGTPTIGNYNGYAGCNGSEFRGGRALRTEKFRVRAAYMPPEGYIVTEDGLEKQ